MVFKFNKSGFTIVELMISISVFSVVIILASAAIITVGRQYQFGVSKTRLLDASRELNQKISQDIAYSGGTVTSISIPGYSGYCIGDNRYLWKTYNNNLDNKDTFKVASISNDLGGSCNNTDTSKGENPFPNNVTVTNLSISSTNPYKYSSRFVLADGLDLFVGNNPDNACITQQAGGSYCAVVPMESTIIRKVQ